MKKLTYLIVTMLMALTMVGCQFDPTYLEDKISGLEESDKEQNDRLDSIESRLAVLEDKVVDADTMLEDLKVWAKDNLKGADGKDGKDGKDGENGKDGLNGKDGKDGLNLTVAQIEQIQADLKTWFEENKSLFKGDKGDNGTSADSKKIAELESAIEELTSKITKVEGLISRVETLESNLKNLETKVNGKADATTILTIDTIKNWYDNYTDKFNSLDLSAYLTVADLGYETKDKVENVAEKLADLTNRVETLNTTINATDGLVATVNTMKFVLGNTESGLVKDFNDLKKAVEDITEKLTYKIGNEEYDIKKLAEKVDALKDIQTRYEDYCKKAIQGLAKLSEVEEELKDYTKIDMSNVDKQTVVNLVKEYVEGEVAKVTNSLTNYVTETELATELASKLDASEITDIINKIDNLKDSLVEEVIYYYLDDYANVYASAYLMFNGKYYGYENISIPNDSKVMGTNGNWLSTDELTTNSPYTFAELEKLALDQDKYNGPYCKIVTEPKTE